MIKAYGFNPVAAQQGLWSTDPIWQANVADNQLNSTQTTYHYLHTDHLYTPILATNKEGSITWKAVQEAFGAMSALNQSRIIMNLRFPGQYYDAETGTHYNFHRDYKPNAGRYVQSDPIGLEGGINLFSYAKNNSLINTDSLGLLVKWSGAMHSFGAAAGIGGQLSYYSLVSECKCNKQYEIQGFASFVILGVGLKTVSGDLGGSSGGVTLEDNSRDCPDPYAANGPAWTSGINLIFGKGKSFLTALHLGRLKSRQIGGGSSYATGLDISAISTLYGHSAVIDVNEMECCSE